MKKIDLGQTINTLANIGVIGGLVFVGLQILQDRKVAEVSALNETATLMHYWVEVVRDSSEVWTDGLAGEPLAPIEAAEFDRIALAWEAFHYGSYQAQSIKGLDPEKYVREWALQLYLNPGLQTWWEDRKRHISYVDPKTAPGTGTYVDAVDQEFERLQENPPQLH